eukprot:UN03620
MNVDSDNFLDDDLEILHERKGQVYDSWAVLLLRSTKYEKATVADWLKVYEVCEYFNTYFKKVSLTQLKNSTVGFY